MNNLDARTLVIGLMGLAVVLAVVTVPLIWLFARTLAALTRATVGTHRESDKERRDMHDMLMKMMETAQVGPTIAMQQHGMERLERMRLETGLEREAIRSGQSGQPAPASPNPDNPDGEVTDDVTLAMV